MSPRPAPPVRITSRLLTSRVVARARRLAELEEAATAAAGASGPASLASDGNATTPPAPAAAATAPRPEPQAGPGLPAAAADEAEAPAPPPAKLKARRKRKMPRAVRDKISRALKGRRKSAKTRARVSETLRGHPVSAGTRAKLSRAMKGRRRSAKTRAKISRSLRGHAVSAETRGKISRKVSLRMRGEGSPSYRHGAYAAPAHRVETIEDVIADLCTKQTQLSRLLDRQMESDGPVSQSVLTLLALHSQNAGKLARLLQYQKAQSDTSADELARAINQALDELGEETGWKL